MSCNYDYDCIDCVDAWELSREYNCNESPNPILDLTDVEVGDCVEFNQGGERIWGRVVEICSCSVVVEVLSTLFLSHPFVIGDKVRLEIKHIYNLDKDCKKI